MDEQTKFRARCDQIFRYVADLLVSLLCFSHVFGELIYLSVRGEDTGLEKLG
jgi:hypothetical protein